MGQFSHYHWCNVQNVQLAMNFHWRISALSCTVYVFRGCLHPPYDLTMADSQCYTQGWPGRLPFLFCFVFKKCTNTAERSVVLVSLGMVHHLLFMSLPLGGDSFWMSFSFLSRFGRFLNDFLQAGQVWTQMEQIASGCSVVPALPLQRGHVVGFESCAVRVFGLEQGVGRQERTPQGEHDYGVSTTFI